MAAIASVTTMSFKVIKNNLTNEERFMHRIRSLYSDLESFNGDLNYMQQVLLAIDDYLCTFEHDYCLDQATIRLKECIFWVAEYNER